MPPKSRPRPAARKDTPPPPPPVVAAEATTDGPDPAVQPPPGPALCITPGCDRKAMFDRQCGAHFAARRGV